MLLIDLVEQYSYSITKYFISHKIPTYWANGDKGDVILVPGFADDHIFLMKIGEELNKNGYKIHSATQSIKGFNTTTLSVQELATKLAGYIAQNNMTNIILVGHSKGGIVAKYLLENFGQISDKIKNVFTIASPHQGTIFAYVGIFHLHQLTPGSNLIKTLKTQTANTHKITNIYPKFDNTIVPNKNLILDGAINQQIKIVGHTRILYSNECTKIIIENLKRT